MGPSRPATFYFPNRSFSTETPERRLKAFAAHTQEWWKSLLFFPRVAFSTFWKPPIQTQRRIKSEGEQTSNKAPKFHWAKTKARPNSGKCCESRILCLFGFALFCIWEPRDERAILKSITFQTLVILGVVIIIITRAGTHNTARNKTTPRAV